MLTEIQIKERLQQQLKPSRYQHTLGVAESAEHLLKKHFPDKIAEWAEKIRVAALLHDCAKNLSAESLLRIADENGLVIDPVSRINTELLHGPVGAVVAKQDYGISDSDILNAITYHTTGRVGMSPLEKIIYLADYIEPGRVFPGVEVLRILAEQDLDKAIIAALNNTIIFVTQNGGLLHPDTILTRNAMLME